MDPGVSDSLGGVFPDKGYATREIRACSRNYQCIPAGKINSIDSRVHGNKTLYAEGRSYHYKLYLILVGSEFCFLAGMSREGTRRHDYYCIQLTIIQCCSNFCFIVTFTALLNYWLILTSCCKTSPKDASLR